VSPEEQPVSERPSAAAEASSDPRRGPRAGSLRLDLRREAQAPARARSAVGGWCPDLEGGASQLETLLLLVSEVVTNAVIHSDAPANAPILLTASVSGEKIRVTVVDAGDGFPAPAQRRPGAADGGISIGGYGLYVVAEAASRWGIDGEGGTRVWFEV
jgi:anti-sigma regulatory factor (Ser/Thr protein kinase)